MHKILMIIFSHLHAFYFIYPEKHSDDLVIFILLIYTRKIVFYGLSDAPTAGCSGPEHPPHPLCTLLFICNVIFICDVMKSNPL